MDASNGAGDQGQDGGYGGDGNGGAGGPMRGDGLRPMRGGLAPGQRYDSQLTGQW